MTPGLIGREERAGADRKLLDDRAERECREEGEAADDHDHADNEADEQTARGRECAGRCRHRFFGGERAGNRHGRDDHPEPADAHRDRAGEIVEHRVGAEPGESGAIVAGLRGVRVEDFGEAVRPGIVHCGDRRRHQHGDGGPAEIHQRQDEDGEHRHLDFLRLDLLSHVFGRAAHHQAGDEDRDDDEEQHPVHAGADAADDDLAEFDVDERDHAPERGAANRAWRSRRRTRPRW